MVQRRGVSFDGGAALILDGVGNRSKYLSRVTEQRWRATQGALSWLRDEGWDGATVLRAMSVLGTSWEQGIGGADCSTPQRILWSELCDVLAVGDKEGLRVDERTCRALCVVAGEWWAGNKALENQLRGAA